MGVLPVYRGVATENNQKWYYQDDTTETISTWGTEGIVSEMGVAWCYQVEITQEAIATRGTEGIPIEVGVAWYFSGKIPRCIIMTLPPRP